MKKVFKKAISVLLVAIMVFGAAPLAGFVGLDLPKVSNFFATKAEAAEEYTEGYYTYTVDSYGKATITDCDTNIRGDVIIPSTLGGHAVTRIGYDAFAWCDSLTSIALPDSVTSIGKYAFAYCDSLTSITIPDSVTSIGDWAFDNTGYYNTESNWENGVLYIGNYLIEAKYDISGSYEMRERTKAIADSAFSLCESLTSITIPDSVTCIGYRAFYGCDSLTSATIPDSVTSIGNEAFYGCESLTSITVDSANTAYSSDEYGVLFNKDKTDLIQYPIGNIRTSYTIPDRVTSIGYGSFAYCDSLTSVTIPDSVTSVGDWAFCGCAGLTSITIPGSVTSIGEYAFSYCTSLTSITIPDSVTSIGEYAFSGCTGLTSVTIPDSVTSIGDCAFEYCTGLTSVTIGNSVTSIGDSAFYNCNSLTSITIPDSVTSIGSSAFRNCFFLTSITIPDSVTSIGYMAFSYCYWLTSITIPSSVTSIGGSAFSGCTSLISITVDSANTAYSSDEYGVLFNKDKTEVIKYPIGNTRTSYEIPDSVTSIGGSAFSGCDSLTSITIPDSVTSIGEHAFSYCDSLTSVTIPDSVTSIGEHAFSHCYSLTSITIPDNVTSIGDWAFEYCTGLTSIIIPDGVTSIGYGAFYRCDSLTDVYYTDTEEEWNAIKIDGYSESLTAATIHFNSKFLIVTDADTGISVEYTYNGDGKVEISVEETTDNTVLEVVNTNLNVTQKTVYDFKMTVDGIETQPDGSVKIKIPLPDGYNSALSSIIYISSEDGTCNEIPSEYIDGYMVFTTKHLGCFAVVEEAPEPPTEPTTNPVTPPVTEPKVTVDIRKPSQTEITYGDSIILHADVENLPAGAKIVWSADNGNFSYSLSSDGKSCTISPSSSGDTTFTATVYDADEKVISADTQKMTSKAGFFQKIIAFFKKLFGLTKIIPQVFKGII